MSGNLLLDALAIDRNGAELIRDKHLYRSTHSTFEAYCEARWKPRRRRATALIDTATTAVQMSEISDTPPGVASHAAELSKVPPEQRAAVWAETVASAPHTPDGRPNVTASHVRAVAEREREPTTLESGVPREKFVPRGNLSTPREDLTRLVRNLRAAIECDPLAAPVAFQRLHAEATRGLYSHATERPNEAFLALVDRVANYTEHLS